MVSGRLGLLSLCTGSVALVIAACSAGGKGGNIFGTGGGTDGSTTSEMGAGAASSSESVGVGFGGHFGNGGSTGSGTTCDHQPNDDLDGDGWTVAQGDCNDCDPNVNPGAIEVVAQPFADGGVPMPADENCDKMIDNVDPPCDDNLALDDVNPIDGAKAIDICTTAMPGDKKYGVLSAAYVRADGSPAAPGLQVGIKDGWGPNVHVQNGKRMLVLSSGHARLPTDPGSCGSLTCTENTGVVPPAGFPQDVPNCPGATNINDDIALQLNLRAPSNATGYSFNFDFYSFEYPEWVCTEFNDQFIALVNPPPQGSINGNICFDSMKNPVSVNIAFFSVCAGCPLGTNELQGTGFDVWDDAGATSWLKTQAPVSPSEEFQIRFTIWDTGDQAWDSTALVDNFQWIANGGSVVVGTNPQDNPK